MRPFYYILRANEEKILIKWNARRHGKRCGTEKKCFFLYYTPWLHCNMIWSKILTSTSTSLSEEIKAINYLTVFKLASEQCIWIEKLLDTFSSVFPHNKLTLTYNCLITLTKLIPDYKTTTRRKKTTREAARKKWIKLAAYIKWGDPTEHKYQSIPIYMN